MLTPHRRYCWQGMQDVAHGTDSDDQDPPRTGGMGSRMGLRDQTLIFSCEGPRRSSALKSTLAAVEAPHHGEQLQQGFLLVQQLNIEPRHN